MSDLISKESLLESIGRLIQKDEDGEWDTEWNDAIHDVIGAIKDEPTAQHWTPMSERPPEKPGRYFVTNCEFEVDWNIWVNGEWLYSNSAPVAWMSLPEPYKEAEK